MPVGLRGDHRLLHARQKLLRLGQRQPQIRDIPKVAGRPELHDVDTRSGAISLRFDQPQNPPHPRSPRPATAKPVISLASSSPHFLDTPKGAANRADIRRGPWRPAGGGKRNPTKHPQRQRPEKPNDLRSQKDVCRVGLGTSSSIVKIAPHALVFQPARGGDRITPYHVVTASR